MAIGCKGTAEGSGGILEGMPPPADALRQWDFDEWQEPYSKQELTNAPK